MLAVNQYNTIFEQAKRLSFPIVDAYESMHGYAINRDKLESIARVLACPFKVNPPNWQHGRVLYTTLRYFLQSFRQPGEELESYPTIFDIGTAKGFSACIMSHAVADAGVPCHILSMDVINPNDRVARNSVLEVGGLKILRDFTESYQNPDVQVQYVGGGSTPWLERVLDQKQRIPFAFVDGKHTYTQVLFEGTALRRLQVSGDVVMFDDCQIEPVGRAVKELTGYEMRYVDIGPRIYAIAIRQ